MTPRFSIGQRFMSRRKYPRECTIVDIHTTTNSVGEIVKIRYVATHDLMGQAVTDYEVTETAVAMGLIPPTEV